MIYEFIFDVQYVETISRIREALTSVNLLLNYSSDTVQYIENYSLIISCIHLYEYND